MIRRLISGLGALGLLGLGLLGLPAFLLAAYDALAAQMPALADLPSVLLAPGDGGLFLLLLFAIGWVCWAVFTAAFVAEVTARARGVRTPQLGAFFPQTTVARTVSAVALMLTLTPAAAQALPPAPAAPVSAPAATTTPTSATVPAAVPAPALSRVQDQALDGAHTDYVVERGDTLWVIADEQLDDPTRYPEIVEASQGITQPDGRHLTDPDLIVTGWTLHVPTDPAQAEDSTEPAGGQPAGESAAAELPGAAAGQSPDQAPVVPPSTPMQAPSGTDMSAAGAPLPGTPLAAPGAAAGTSGGPARAASAPVGPPAPALPATPLRGGSRNGEPPAREAVYDAEGRFAPEHGVLGLPNWISGPLNPVRPEDAPELIAEAERILAAHSAAIRGQTDATG
jgi:LysM repeat protein